MNIQIIFWKNFSIPRNIVVIFNFKNNENLIFKRIIRQVLKSINKLEIIFFTKKVISLNTRTDKAIQMKK